LNGPAHLLVYRDNKMVFPDHLLANYLSDLSVSIVLDNQRTFALEETEAILVYQLRPKSMGG
jgi:hypothetical protein